MRLRLSNEAVDVINEFGPKLFDHFDQVWFHFGGSTALLLILDSSAFWYPRVHPHPVTQEFGDGRAAWDKWMRKEICLSILW